MIEILDLLKPKRLLEDKRAILSNEFIAIDFQDTIIYKKCDTKFPLSEISIKNLFTNNFDYAERIDKFDLNIPNLTTSEILIDSFDSTFFSSVNASGEDLFITGLITISKDSIRFDVLGLTFMLSYSVKKTININNDISFYIDHNVFYYLFQMFKHINGKKNDHLVFSFDKGKLYLTNRSNDFYIICNQRHEYYNTLFNLSKNVYFKQKYISKDVAIKKEWIIDKDSFIKHLIRPFDDILNIENSQIITQIKNDTYCLYINKEKA